MVSDRAQACPTCGGPIEVQPVAPEPKSEQVSSTREEAGATVELTGFEQVTENQKLDNLGSSCLLYTSPSPRDYAASRMPSSA